MKTVRHLLLVIALAAVPLAQARFHHPAHTRCERVEPTPNPIQPGPSPWLVALLDRIRAILFPGQP